MWSVLGQYQSKPKAGEGAGAEQAPAPPGGTDAPKAGAEHEAPSDEALAQREAQLDERAAALDKAAADLASRTEAASQREANLDEREAGLAAREKAVREQESSLVAQREQLAEREAEAQRAAAALSSREQALEAAEAHARPAATAEGAGATAKADVSKAKPAEADASGAKAAHRAVEPKKVDPLDSQRSKVRFDAASKPTGAAAAPPPAAAPSGKPAGTKAEDTRDIPCDATAEWLRSENLTASLVRQRSENPDEVFFPLPNQRTCELADIFSAPRRRERGKGSGEWTPMSTEDATRVFAPAAAPKEAPAALQLLGVDGEYMGEQLALPALPSGANAPVKIMLIGRSSSCDVTLSRDDQISRRHMQIEARDGKLLARDLGST